jgi:hypothetical protein
LALVPFVRLFGPTSKAEPIVLAMAPLLGKRPRHQNFALKQLLDGVEGEQVKASLRKKDGGQFALSSLSSEMSRIRRLVLLEGFSVVASARGGQGGVPRVLPLVT